MSSTKKKNSTAGKLRLSPFNLSRPGHIHNNTVLHNIHDKKMAPNHVQHTTRLSQIQLIITGLIQASLICGIIKSLEVLAFKKSLKIHEKAHF